MVVSGLLCNLAIVIIAGCGAGMPVRVLPKGGTTVSASVGGPIVSGKSPTGIIPYLTAGTAHGVTNDVTVHANAHLLMSAFAVLGVDAGLSGRALKGDGWVPEITIAGRALLFTDFQSIGSTRLYPDLAATLSWELATDVCAYAGSHVTFQWRPSATFVSPMIGIQFPLSDKFSLQTELIWQASNVNTQSGIFEGASTIGTTGSFGGFLAGVYTL